MGLPGMRTKRRAALVLALLGCASASCIVDEVFACVDDASCTRGGDGGTCELNGYCSFPDDDCESGQRYGSLAGGGFADACVDPDTSPSTGTPTSGPDDPTTGSEPPTTGLETSDDASTSSPLATTAAADTTTATTGTDACPDWWDCQWQSRRHIELPALNLAEGLANFPLPVVIDTDLDLATLRVVGPDGEIWAHEHESDVLWVRVPELPANATLSADLYFDNPAAEDTADADAVWDDDYVAVWHMNDARDVSGVGNDAMASKVSYVRGIVGTATRFDGDTSLLQVPATASLADLLTDGMTVTAWVRFGAAGNYARILDKSDVATSTRGWSLLIDQSTAVDRLRFDIGFEFLEMINTAPLSTAAEWHHVAVTANASEVTMMINGEPMEVTSGIVPKGPPGSDVNLPVGIGVHNNPIPLNVLEGMLDEVRISSTQRSSSWLSATFHTSKLGATVVGPEEQAPAR